MTLFRSLRWLALALLLLPTIAFAHEHRTVAGYTLVVGFKNEPAYQDEQNGVWLKVTKGDDGPPVTGLADTLKVEVAKDAASVALPLQAAFAQDGVYVANFYPTEAGDYTFHFTGTIEGTAINESFTSAPGGFNAVQSTSELQFPVKPDAAASTAAALETAQQTARTALLVGGAGLVAGLIGLFSGVVAIVRRRPSAADLDPVINPNL